MKKFIFILLVLFACTKEESKNVFTVDCTKSVPYINCIVESEIKAEASIFFNIDNEMKFYRTVLNVGINNFNIYLWKCPEYCKFIKIEYN